MKALLIGSSFSAAPMLLDLKHRGAHVTVIGKFKDDPCHAHADRSIFEDYSDRESLANICRENNFDYIVPTCNDYSYIAAAFVANKMGFPGFDSPETTAILHTKNRFRRFCRALDVPAPRIYGEVSVMKRDLPEGILGPALVKPVDSFSGRGVQLVHSASDLPAAIDQAFMMSRCKGAVVEQFVEGTLHSHTAFIAAGQIVWHDFVDEYCEVYPYQVDRSTYPSTLSSALRAAVQDCAKRIVSELALCDGLLHTQFIASQSEFWIIECMRRCPGDLYGYHFWLALDYKYERQYVAAFVGAQPEAPVTTGSAKLIERRVISVHQPINFFGVGIECAGRKATYVPLKESGGRLEAAPFDKAGIFFLEGRIGDCDEGIAACHTGVLAH